MLAGGLRVKTISYFDGTSGRPIKQKHYRYGEYEDGVGEILRGAADYSYDNEDCYTYGNYTPLFYTQTIPYVIKQSDGSLDINNRTICTEIKYTYKPSSSKDLTYSSGSPVYYTKVTEYNSDMGVETGKTVYRYYPPQSFNSNYGEFLTVGNIPHIKTKWDIGLIQSVTKYRYKDQQYFLEHQKQTFYKKFNKTEINAKCAYINSRAQAVDNSYSKVSDPLNIYDYCSYSAKDYTIPIGKMLIDKEIEKWGYDQNEVIQETVYEYEGDYVQSSKTITTRSDGNKVVTSFKYPYHFSDKVYANMVRANNISPVIEKSILKGGKENKEFVDYREDVIDSKTLIVPSRIRKSYNGGSPQTEFVFDQYDKYGNLLQMKERDNIVKSYLWGYDSRLLLAEITGATYNTVENILNMATIQSPNSESVLENELLKLQSNSNIPFTTTLTYDNTLSVIKSITGANKTSQYYNYDGFGRLISQLDENISVVSDIEYKQIGFKEKIADKRIEYVKSPSMESFNFYKNEAYDGTIGLCNYIDYGGYNPFGGTIWNAYNKEFPNQDDYNKYDTEAEGGNAVFYRKTDLSKILISAPYHTYGHSLQYDYENNLDLKGNIQIIFIQGEHIVAAKIFRIEDYQKAKILELYIPAGEYKIAFRFKPYDGAVFASFMTNQNNDNSIWSGNTISLKKGNIYELFLLRFK